MSSHLLLANGVPYQCVRPVALFHAASFADGVVERKLVHNVDSLSARFGAAAGTEPVSAFAASVMDSRLVSAISAGIDPVNALWSAKKNCRLVSDVNDGGMLPLS